MKNAILVAIAILTLSACSAGLEDVKKGGVARWNELGYHAVYEGYNKSFSGAEVWYTLTRPDIPGVVFTGSLVKWGDELQVQTNPHPLVAVMTQHITNTTIATKQSTINLATGNAVLEIHQ